MKRKRPCKTMLPGAHRGGGPAGIAAVLLSCARIGRADVRRRALPVVVPEQPSRAHEIRHVRREHVLGEMVHHAGLSVSLLRPTQMEEVNLAKAQGHFKSTF